MHTLPFAQSQRERESEAKELFIKTHPFFAKWTEEQQHHLGNIMLKRIYSNHEMILKQGEKYSGLFFIIK